MARRPNPRQFSMPLARIDDPRYRAAEALARDPSWAEFVALQEKIPTPLLVEAVGVAVYGGVMSARIGKRVLQSLGNVEPEDRSHAWLAGKGMALRRQGGRPEILGETSVRAWACIHAFSDGWLGLRRGVDFGRLTPEGCQNRLDAIAKNQNSNNCTEDYYSTLL